MTRQAQVKMAGYEKAEMERSHARAQYFKYGEKVLGLEEQYAVLTEEILAKLANPDS